MDTTHAILTSVLASNVQVGDVLQLHNYLFLLTVKHVKAWAQFTLVSFNRPGRNAVTVAYVSTDTVYINN